VKKKLKAVKTLSLALSTALTLSAVPFVPSYAGAEETDAFFLRGDLDKDGITGNDALRIIQNDAGSIQLSADELLRADTNGDGKVSLADAVGILQYIASSDVSLHTVGEYVAYQNKTFVPEASRTDADNYEKINMTADVGNRYKLRFTYMNDSGTDQIVTINSGEAVSKITLPPTNGEYTEKAVVIPLENTGSTYSVSVSKADGVSIKSILACATSNALDPYEKISDLPVVTTTENVQVTTTAVSSTVVQTTTTTAETPTEPPVTTTYKARYYAVEAEGYDGWEETTNAGFEGKAYWNYNNVVGSYVKWTVDVPADGNYKVDFRFANGTAANRPVNISVNGAKEVANLDFDGTGAWTSWSVNSIVLPLKAGKNTIKATATTSGGGPNMDYIELTQTDSSAVSFVKDKSGRQVEKLNRGVVAAYTGSGVLVSWRHLATDSDNTTFNLWRIRSENDHTLLGTFTMEQASNYFDKDGLSTDSYTIDTYVGDECTEFAQFSLNFPNKNSGQSGAYFDIPTQKPADQTMPDGTTCTYTENDCSVGDVDGDGQYEVFVKWDPSNSQDNSKNGYTGSVFIDCYKLDGTLLWRIDLGKNIRAGAHYTQYMVYDFDGDGKAELICKTADGTKDGKGNYVGDKNKDYRSSAGRILEGPEYLTLFDGATGAILDTVDYKPGRGDYTAWGDNYGNRVDRFVACVAYLDGKNASAVFGRGYYTRVAHTAYNVVNKKLVEVWAFDTGNNSSVAGYGDGNHHSLGADVDGDGKDEVVYGSGVIDDNGKLLYTTGLAHGDAIHIGDFVPSNPGLEIFQCLEDESHPNGTAVNYGTILRDAGTGKVLFRETAGDDTGRCIADNLIAGNDGAEMSGSHNSILYDCTTGKQMTDANGNGMTFGSITKWGQNSVVYWTDVLERAVLDRTMADQYGKGRVFTGDGVTYNNASKSNACLTCDLTGDWREEMIFRKSEGGLRVFTTTYTTEYPIYSLMHNPQYRVQVAAQNNGYNQPPHTDFFIGTGFALPTAPNVWSID